MSGRDETGPDRGEERSEKEETKRRESEGRIGVGKAEGGASGRETEEIKKELGDGKVKGRGGGGRSR